jgi:hypothetical protein
MLKVQIKTQPTDVTCGPTSLHSVYQFYGDNISLQQTIAEVRYIKSGGTLAPLLGVHALQRGYRCSLYAYNIDIIDPSWFIHQPLTTEKLIEKLKKQMKYKKSHRIQETSWAYIDFLRLGGHLLYKNLTPQLLKNIFMLNIPIVAALSATYLYQSMREYEDSNGKLIFDDLRGEPCGHIVVLCGYDETHRHIIVADPHKENPISANNYYKVSLTRLINAIILGVLTHDANLLLVK